MAWAKVAPTATTVRTRPPAVTKLPSFTAVPAWKTSTPSSSWAASIPEIGLPVSVSPSGTPTLTPENLRRLREAGAWRACPDRWTAARDAAGVVVVAYSKGVPDTLEALRRMGNDTPRNLRALVSVAGVVSGAGGINPGLTLTQEGLMEGGQNVALSGRVYALATAANGPIKPGDLLTTSDVPGHLMKATDRDRAYGTVLGKGMTGLEAGEGLVLVLVNLQ